MRIYLLLIFIGISSILNAQRDTVFVRTAVYDDDYNLAGYTTDTTVFETAMIRSVLIGTTIIPNTTSQMIANNSGLYFENIVFTPCDGPGEEYSSRIENVLFTEDSLTISTRVYANCCQQFLCDIEMTNDSTLNLKYITYGGSYCGCTCCFGLDYQFSLLREAELFPALKYVMIGNDRKTLKKLKS